MGGRIPYTDVIAHVFAEAFVRSTEVFLPGNEEIMLRQGYFFILTNEIIQINQVLNIINSVMYYTRLCNFFLSCTISLMSLVKLLYLNNCEQTIKLK